MAILRRKDQKQSDCLYASQLCFSVVKFILGSFTSSERFNVRLLCQMHTNFMFSYIMFCSSDNYTMIKKKKVFYSLGAQFEISLHRCDSR